MVICTARAQISVEVDFDKEQYLSGEPVIANVRIVNFSGRTLELGATDGWLRFDVETSKNVFVAKIGEPNLVEKFEIPSAGRGTRRVNLGTIFDIMAPGRYMVSAAITIPTVSGELMSKAVGFNVMAGAPIWERDFGLPDGSETRKYSLVQAMSQKDVRLFLRISDQHRARYFSVILLGPVLSFSKPETQVDSQARLHVLFQVSGRAFLYYVVQPDGTVARRNTFQYSGTRPLLKADREGEWGVVGGMQLVTAEDIPAHEPGDADSKPQGPLLPKPVVTEKPADGAAAPGADASKTNSSKAKPAGASKRKE